MNDGRHVEPEILPTCARHGIGVTVFSPLAQGLLTGKYNEGATPESRGARSDWLKRDLTEENVARVRQLTALAWILRRPEISAVITGATNPAHVLSNVKAAGVKLTSDVLEEIEGILENAP